MSNDGAGELVFAAPWEARVFALTQQLAEVGAVSRTDWTNALSLEIAGGEDEDYYSCWLAALEGVLVEHSLLSRDELEGRQEAWRRAAARTPHGEPVELGRA